MSFSFPQIDPETSGRVTSLPVPLDKYLGASFESGQHDSALGSIQRMGEISQENLDPSAATLTPEEANKKYAVGDLKFDQPVKENVAQTMNERKRSEMDREFYLSQGASKMRFLPGMAASLLGGMSNPVDLSMMFVPVVGEEAAAAKVARAGGGMFRQMLARGLLTHETLEAARVPVPKIVGAMVQGTAQQALYEIPNLMASAQDRADYTYKNALVNVGAGGLLAGGLHLAGDMFRTLTRSTHDAMSLTAVNQFLNDEETRVHQYVNIDEGQIERQVKFDEEQSRHRAIESMSDADVREAVRKQYQEDINFAAVKGESGDTYIGSSHADAWSKANANGDLRTNIPAEEFDSREGFMTDSGRFVSRREAGDIAGTGDDWMNHFDLPDDEGNRGFGNFGKAPTGMDQDAWVRENVKRSADAYFFSRPETQRLIDQERTRRIQQFIDNERANYDPRTQRTRAIEKEIVDQQRAGKILTPEIIEKYLTSDVTDPRTLTAVSKDVETLREGFGEKSAGGEKQESGSQKLYPFPESKRAHITQDESGKIHYFYDDKETIINDIKDKITKEFPEISEKYQKELEADILKEIRESHQPISDDEVGDAASALGRADDPSFQGDALRELFNSEEFQLALKDRSAGEGGWARHIGELDDRLAQFERKNTPSNELLEKHKELVAIQQKNLEEGKKDKSGKAYLDAIEDILNTELDHLKQVQDALKRKQEEKTSLQQEKSELQLSPDEQRELDSVPKPQGAAIDSALDCLLKKIV